MRFRGKAGFRGKAWFLLLVCVQRLGSLQLDPTARAAPGAFVSWDDSEVPW